MCFGSVQSHKRSVIAIVITSSRLLPGSSYSCCIHNLHALVHKQCHPVHITTAYEILSHKLCAIVCTATQFCWTTDTSFCGAWNTIPHKVKGQKTLSLDEGHIQCLQHECMRTMKQAQAPSKSSQLACQPREKRKINLQWPVNGARSKLEVSFRSAMVVRGRRNPSTRDTTCTVPGNNRISDNSFHHQSDCLFTLE
jgi:hypothetical protein